MEYMDKAVLKFLADVLYIKKIICFEEFEAIMESKNPLDLDDIVEKMLKEEYNVYKQGESYLRYGKHSTRSRGRKLGDSSLTAQDAEIHTSVHDRAVHVEQTGTTS